MHRLLGTIPFIKGPRKATLPSSILSRLAEEKIMATVTFYTLSLEMASCYLLLLLFPISIIKVMSSVSALTQLMLPRDGGSIHGCRQRHARRVVW